MSNYEAYLRTSLAKYSYPDLAKTDILNAFRTYNDLRPKLDGFVFNDGARKELLCLDGTIPVNYKGNTYNIPMCMWLLDSHPYNPPMAFVKPTATMQIKPGQHVDNNGKVYLPYLHDWRHPESDLLGLIQVLVIVFGENPPVFSRSTPPARPPPPGQGAGGTPYPTEVKSITPQLPRRELKPSIKQPSCSSAGLGGMPMPYPGQQSAGAGYPPATGTFQGYPPAAGAGTTNPAYPAQGSGYPAQQATQQNYNPAYTPAPAINRAGTILPDDQIKLSLVSAIEDKIKRKMRDIFAQHQAEMDTLKRTQDDLQKGKATLEGMLEKLASEQLEVETNITVLREKCGELKETVSQLENREELSIDDSVVPTAPLYKQLLNLFAEEQATEDALYYLGEGLRKGVLELDVFLKNVREMSRKQFMLRALIHKCREKAGLPEL